MFLECELRTTTAHCPCCGEVGGSVLCSVCMTPHHEDCWSYCGEKCAVFGCGSVQAFREKNNSHEIIVLASHEEASYTVNKAEHPLALWCGDSIEGISEEIASASRFISAAVLVAIIILSLL